MTAEPDGTFPAIEIVRADYSSLTAIIARIESYRDVLRGATLSLWAAAIGFGFANKSSIPPLVVILPIAVLAWADLRLDYQYAVAHRRSIELEKIIQAYVSRVLETGRTMESQAKEQLEDLLTQYTFGSNLNLMRPTAEKIVEHADEKMSWPTILYFVLILALFAAAVAVA